MADVHKLRKCCGRFYIGTFENFNERDEFLKATQLTKNKENLA
jgi:hypothetical protein